MAQWGSPDGDARADVGILQPLRTYTHTTGNPVLSSDPVGNQAGDVPILFPARKGGRRDKLRAWSQPSENLEVVVEDKTALVLAHSAPFQLLEPQSPHLFNGIAIPISPDGCECMDSTYNTGGI